jgi:glucokinase/fructokinase
MFEGAEGQRSEVVSAPSPDSYRGFLVLVEQMARELVQAPVAAVGCGLPGSSDSDQVLFVPALPWMVGHPLRRDLESLLGARVILGLDGHFTLLAEATEGAAKGYASTDSRVRHGKQGTAGSWGWLPLPALVIKASITASSVSRQARPCREEPLAWRP